MWGRLRLTRRTVQVGATSSPAWLAGACMAWDFHSFVCFLHRREGLGLLPEGGKIGLALQDPALGPPLVFLPPWFLFLGAGLGHLQRSLQWSPPHLCPPSHLSPPFPCGLRPSCIRDQHSFIQDQGCASSNKNLFLWPLESGQGVTENLDQNMVVFLSHGPCMMSKRTSSCLVGQWRPTPTRGETGWSRSDGVAGLFREYVFLCEDKW